MATESCPDILSAEHAADPYATYRTLREEFPVVYHEGTSSWLVSRHEDLSKLFKHPGISSENYVWQLEPAHGFTILQMEGREHTAHRRLMSPFFHGKGLEQFTETVAVTAHSAASPLLDRERQRVAAGTSERGETDIVADFTNDYPIDVIENMLGLPKQDRPKFKRWYRAIIDFLGNIAADPEVHEAGLQARQELTEYFLPVIDKRRGGDGEDFISRLCRAEVDGTSLSDENIRAFISLMLAAGGETTDRALASLFKNLVEHPDQLAAVYEDRRLITDAFAETLRYSPPAHMIFRQPTEDVEIGGVRIPAGALVTCMLAAANRDQERFADPDVFDLFREDNSTERAFGGGADHFAFAGGRHYCVGAMLARQEVELGVGHLLDHMVDLRLKPGFVPREVGIYTRAPQSLELTFIPA